MKFLVCLFLLLTAAFAAERVYAKHKLERRARRAVNTLRVVVDPDSDNLEPVSVVYFPSTHALCVEYKNQDRSGTPYISHGVLLDGDNRVSYEVQMQDDLFTDHCAGVYDRTLVDLTATVK
jgi:hypothetical protein